MTAERGPQQTTDHVMIDPHNDPQENLMQILSMIEPPVLLTKQEEGYDWQIPAYALRGHAPRFEDASASALTAFSQHGKDTRTQETAWLH